MLTSMTLVMLLHAPSVGADGLSVADSRLTHGVLGATRSDTKVRPGDSLTLSFDIQGINTDETGKASYSTAVEVTDASGKTLFKQPSRKFQEFLPLGGSVLPAFAQIDLGLDSPAGEYAMKVTVTNEIDAKSVATTQKFQVLPKGFDLVRISVSGDADGIVPVGAYVVGQPFWFHAAVVGFSRGNTAAKQPNVTVALRILDENGKPLVAKPFTGLINKDVPSNANSLPVRFYVPLNKAGKYTIEVLAHDDLSKGPLVSKQFPLTVLGK